MRTQEIVTSPWHFCHWTGLNAQKRKKKKKIFTITIFGILLLFEGRPVLRPTQPLPGSKRAKAQRLRKIAFGQCAGGRVYFEDRILKCVFHCRWHKFSVKNSDVLGSLTKYKSKAIPKNIISPKPKYDSKTRD